MVFEAMVAALPYTPRFDLTMPAPCPSEEDLFALATGNSNAPRHAVTLAHLEVCDDCRSLVSELLRDNVGRDATEFPDSSVIAAEAEPRPFRPGQLIAEKFRVGRVIGEGGMGVVVEAEHVLLEERVALKFMHRNVASHPDAVTRFLREARASSKIKSEHVARVIDVGTHEGMPYLVMEYLQGRDLATVLADDGALPVERAVGYVLQACEALSRAHERGLVHRDLKPANMFLADREGGEPPILKVLDFGIAKALDVAEVPAMTASNAFLGSPRYMAPEQVQNARDVDTRADIWALGAILFELLSGRPAFDQPSVAALLVAICTQPAPTLRSIRPEVPTPIAELVAACLRIDPAARPASVQELAQRLRGAPAPVEATPIATPRRRGAPLLWGAGAFLAVGFAVGYHGLSAPGLHSDPQPLSRAALVAPASAVPAEAPPAPALRAEPTPTAASSSSAAPLASSGKSNAPAVNPPRGSAPKATKGDMYGERH